MSLPPGFLDELRSRLTLSAVVGRKVTWDMRKSNQARGDWWAPCPFHQERTASFHVDDRKGFYYCFGCHAKGDALTFVRESENLPFLEAVAVLAAEAGMAMPERDPQARAQAERRGELHEVMEEILRFYRLQLRTAAAAPARDYLTHRRGLDEAALTRWEIGWSPANGQALVEALAAKGIPPEVMLASGAVAKAESGRLYDRFHGRIIFPIRDGRGRAISFGGRALDPNARAKYLNGPETALFDKGRNLFNLGPAREAAGKGATLIVAEGYMDVIALVEAGFAATVAPLGTAITEDQLRLMWRLSDEPVIALDGDKAGMRAALRLADLALPLLTAGKGLRFALLPGGKDPDDLLRSDGPAAMQRVIETAQPMVALLWQRETAGHDLSTPERQAALEARLARITAAITDRLIQRRYVDTLERMKRDLFWSLGARGPKTGGARRAAQRRSGGRAGPGFGPATTEAAPRTTTRASILATTQAPEDVLREAVILAVLVRFPALVARFEAGLERLEMAGADHGRLRNLLLTHAHEGDCRARIAADSPGVLERLMAHPHVRISPALNAQADEELAAACVEEALARLQADRAHRAELEDAMQEVAGLADEGLTWRIGKASEARRDASRGPREQAGETVIAPNGVALDRRELDEARSIFDSVDFSRGGRRRG